MYSFIKFVAAAIAIVKEVEQLIPESGKGAAKLAMVKSMLEVVYEDFDDLVEPFMTIWNKVEKIINKIVTIFNDTGIFKK